MGYMRKHDIYHKIIHYKPSNQRLHDTKNIILVNIWRVWGSAPIYKNPHQLMQPHQIVRVTSLYKCRVATGEVISYNNHIERIYYNKIAEKVAKPSQLSEYRSESSILNLQQVEYIRFRKAFQEFSLTNSIN